LNVRKGLFVSQVCVVGDQKVCTNSLINLNMIKANFLEHQQRLEITLLSLSMKSYAHFLQIWKFTFN